jgi:hypothetical protein
MNQRKHSEKLLPTEIGVRQHNWFGLERSKSASQRPAICCALRLIAE